MQYRERPPDPALRPFVRTYWTLSGPSADSAPQPVLPDGSTELIVHRARPFLRHTVERGTSVNRPWVRRAEEAPTTLAALDQLEQALLRRLEARPPRCDERVGATLGLIARAGGDVRVERAAAARLVAEPSVPLAGVSGDGGYFDQSHMIRDFVTFAGSSPEELRKRLGPLTAWMMGKDCG